MNGGECLICSKVNSCSETSAEKIKQSYVCVLFHPVSEPVYLARLQMLNEYGEQSAIIAILNRPPELEE